MWTISPYCRVSLPSSVNGSRRRARQQARTEIPLGPGGWIGPEAAGAICSLEREVSFLVKKLVNRRVHANPLLIIGAVLISHRRTQRLHLGGPQSERCRTGLKNTRKRVR